MNDSNWTVAELLKLSGSYWNTCALHAGVKLDLFTALSDKTRDAAELAVEKNLSARGLAMLLDALTALQLLTKSAERYAATAFAARFLNRSAPEYLGHIILHHHHLVDGWSRLDQAVSQGSPVRQRVSHDAAEQERESFLLGMFNLAMLSAPSVASQLDLSGCRRLLDLGGGPGTWAIHFCQRNPQLQAVIFDLPTTRPFAEQTVADFGLTKQIQFEAGDFMSDPLPTGFDIAWLSQVLHGEGPEHCAHLVTRAATTLESGGRLLVQEFILHNDRTGPLFPALFSLNMLLGTPGGQAYTEAELGDFLRQAGLVKVERLPLELPNGAGIMQARKP